MAAEAYSLNSTIGQPNVGAQSGGRYSLNAGFWAGVELAQDTAAPPVLRITRAEGGTVAIAWPAASTSYQLQETSSLSPPISWMDLTQTPMVTGAEKTVLLPDLAGNKFYRLIKR